MSKLVKLKDSKGHSLHINPDHVVIVSGLVDKSQIVFGESSIMLFGGVSLSVLGTQEEISALLNSGGNVSSLLA